MTQQKNLENNILYRIIRVMFITNVTLGVLCILFDLYYDEGVFWFGFMIIMVAYLVKNALIYIVFGKNKERAK